MGSISASHKIVDTMKQLKTVFISWVTSTDFYFKKIAEERKKERKKYYRQKSLRSQLFKEVQRQSQALSLPSSSLLSAHLAGAQLKLFRRWYMNYQFPV